MTDVATLALALEARTTELERDLKRASNRIDDFSRRAGKSGKGYGDTMGRAAASTRRFQMGVQNASYQIGDFAVQVAGGTSAARAVSQQLPQLLGPMGMIGAVGGAAVAILIPLAQQFLFNSEAAEKLSKALEELGKEAGEANDAYRQFALGLSSSSELAVVDEIARLTKERVKLEEKLAKASGQNKRAFQEQLAANQEQVNKLNEALEKRRKSVEQQERITDNVQATTDAERLLGEQMQETARAAALVAYETERTRNAAMEAAREWLKVNEFKSRFAGEEAVMSQPVVVPGRGDLPPALSPEISGAVSAVTELKEVTEQLEADTKESLDAQLQNWGTFFGELSGITVDGNNKVLRAARTFSAAEALINSYRAATQALADPTVPFWGKAAAYAATLSAGLGAVNAIRGAQSAGGGAGVAAASGATTSLQQSAQRQSINLQLTGSSFSAGSVRDLINQINEASEGGATIRLV